MVRSLADRTFQLRQAGRVRSDQRALRPNGGIHRQPNYDHHLDALYDGRVRRYIELAYRRDDHHGGGKFDAGATSLAADFQV